MKKQIAFGALLLCTGSSGAYYYAQREYGYDLGIFRTFYKYTYSLNPGLAVSITKALCFHNLLWKEQQVQGNIKLGIFDIKNPIGLASGFDECGAYIEALQNLGFGFIEIGSVAMHGTIKNNEDKNTYEPQTNNQVKYASELPQNGILKTKAAISTLRKSSQLNVPIGVSIMPSEDIYMYTPYLISSDLENSFRELCTIADYVVINLTGSHRIQPQYTELVSSNSTVFPSIFRQLRKVQQEEIGLQAAIEHEFYNEPIEMKVSDVLNSQPITSKKELGTQLFVKITDGDDQSLLLKQLCQSAKSAEIDGIILAKHTVGNTQDYLKKLQYLQQSVPKGFPIISVGEINSKNDVQVRIANGATACQILSQFIIQGPSSVKEMLL